eukprot:Gregarina_sp_Poly_1__3304@NODE_194_length_11600_cov_132_592994_g173_i0_p1_GENE_NODE_194_length_11600_cov_132_592994_g173_i0NODE_194_length_11600_cov_132_592994_g173_i0_p1_ORF_typecomplete_len801_score123_71KH_1/PF00013_29/0_055KH_1/PF00013_29/0_33KH_1/PF00013_29/1_3e02KH_1/PF00013_29/5_8e05KH_4/PF13083_6/27KH_4/PF13083_6/2KH_4/PF13083_6/5_2e02MOEP19/PF16005_5/1_5e03MOEP19/PF16005_5/0_38_NODE_194_length_11600_cov_132_592994_g173_i015623964
MTGSVPEPRAETGAAPVSTTASTHASSQPVSEEDAVAAQEDNWDRSRSGSIDNKLNDDEDAQLAEHDSCKQEDEDEEEEDAPLKGRRPGEDDMDDDGRLMQIAVSSKRKRGSSRGGDSEVVSAISVEELLKPDVRPDGTMVATARTLVSRLAELPPGVGYGNRKTVIRIGDEEAAFVLGRQGRTKAKIGRVSGCRVNLTNNLDLELIGSPEARARAELYVKLVVQQRRGPVIIDFDNKDRNDLTIVDVPTNCVAFVTGQQGHVLRSIEEEWATLMFFVRHINDIERPQTSNSMESNAEDSLVKEETGGGEERDGISTAGMNREMDDYSVPPKEGEPERQTYLADDGISEKLLIFGDERGRRGAELKVMSAVEQKNPRRFSSLFTPEYVSDRPGFDTDRALIGKEDFSYALGKDGATRRKLAKASHCILEYIGRIAFIAGTQEERSRCREYLGWLIQQRTTAIHVDTTGRSDVTTIVVPKNLVQSVAGPRGTTLRKLEGISQTFCFIDAETPNCNEERLLIFSHSAKARETARQVLYDQMDRFCARRALTRDKAAPKSEYIYQDPTERSRGSIAVGNYASRSTDWPSEHFVQSGRVNSGGGNRRSRRSRADRKRAQKVASLDGPLQPVRSPVPRGLEFAARMPAGGGRQMMPRMGSPHADDMMMEAEPPGWRHNGSTVAPMRSQDRSRKLHEYPPSSFREDMMGRPLHHLSPPRSPGMNPPEMYGSPDMWYPSCQYGRGGAPPMTPRRQPENAIRYASNDLPAPRRRNSYGEARAPYREDLNYELNSNGPPPKRRMLRHNL